MEGLNEKDWVYLSKGAANLVLAYNGNSIVYKDHVLRLRIKENGISTEQIFEYVTNMSHFCEIRPWIVSMELTYLNKEFNAFWKVVLKEQYGIVMPNIMPCISPHKVEVNKYIKIWHNETRSDIVLEFKPKWLNYNSDSRLSNCRNCLIAKLKNEKFILCPLWLLDGSKGVEIWCQNVQKRVPFNIIDKLKMVIGGQEGLTVLTTLKDLQCKNINSYYQNPNEELQLQMTLRDVSIFYNLNTGKITILDLDLKPLTKLHSWIETEQKLRLLYRDESIGVQCCIQTQ